MSALLIQKYVPVQYGLKSRYFLGFGVAILSHVVLDSISHSEYNIESRTMMLWLFMETILILAIMLFGQKNTIVRKIIVWGIIGGALPDGLYFIDRYTGWDWFLLPHNFLHITHGTLPWLYANYYVQILITLGAIFFVRAQSAQ